MTPSAAALPLPRRRLALVGLLATVAILAGTLPAGPAIAAPATTEVVTTKADLAAALAAAPDTAAITIRLDAPLVGAGSANEVQTVPEDAEVVLDLHGNALRLSRIVIEAGATLAITDSASTTTSVWDEDRQAVLTVDARSQAAGSATAIALEPDARLSVSTVTVHVVAGARGAGIGSEAGDPVGRGHLGLELGAVVRTEGGEGGAGIGGGQGAVPIDVDITGARVQATGGIGGAGIGSGREGIGTFAFATHPVGSAAHPRDASVYALGGAGAASIGGGALSEGGGVVTIGAHTDVQLSQSGFDRRGPWPSPSGIGAGQGGGDFGALTVQQDGVLLVNHDTTLHVPAGAVVRNHGRITLTGAIDGAGSIENDGSILTHWYGGDGGTYPGTRVAASLHVTGRSYRVRLDPNGGTVGAHDSFGVWSDSLEVGAFAPPHAADPGSVLVAWNTRADGSGRDARELDLVRELGSSTGTPLETTVYAQYGRKPFLTSDRLPDAVVGAAYDARLPVGGDVAWFGIRSSDDQDDPVPALPAGLSLDEDTGRVTGVPTESGRFALRLAAGGASYLEGVVTLVVAPAAAAPMPASPSATVPAGVAPVPAPAAPALAGVPRTTVKPGHRIDLRVAASSTVPVTFSVVAGAFPRGLSLHAGSGLISGTPAQSGTFTATIRATSSAGSASTPVTIVVPEVVELIDAAPVPAVEVGGGTVPLKVAGFKKGERWRIQVDGKTVKTGVMKKAGSLKASVRLAGGRKDAEHVITVSGSRKVTDPAKRAATVVTVTSLAPTKTLSVRSTEAHGKATVTTAGLAAGEAVVVKDGRKVVAKGEADQDGEFAFTSAALAKGTHRLAVTGATPKRSGKTTLR